MDSWILIMMMGVSLTLGIISLLAVMWAIKNGHFDDEEKFLNQVQYDGNEELQEAAKREQKQDRAKKQKKEYRPPD